MKRLTGGLQNYAWGSTTLLAQLRGEDASAEPEAEIWYGAHRGTATLCEDGTSLLDHIVERPVEMLGQDVIDGFGVKLPFLLKLLAAGSPLSIQAHPSIEQAQAGFAREDAAGIPRDAPNRSFRDDNHKPELICALTPFEALVGFRAVDQTLDFFDSLGFIRLHPILKGRGPKGAVELLLDPDAFDAVDEVQDIVTELVEATNFVVDSNQWSSEAALIRRLAEAYPGDPGIAVAGLLNYVVLEPGEALYLGAGNMHAYVSGLGVEIMANSDNVLRGGLTPKHIDVNNLLDVVLPEALDPAHVEIDDEGRYLTPAPEFELQRLSPSDGAEVDGPCILLCTSDTFDVISGDESVSLKPTDAVWLGAGERAKVTGDAAVAYRASVGRSTTLVNG